MTISGKQAQRNPLWHRILLGAAVALVAGYAALAAAVLQREKR